MREDELRDYLKKAVKDLQKARQRLRDMEAQAHEPIAVIGMSCRYPGGIESPRDLWETVLNGRDVITEWPTDRGWDSLLRNGVGPIDFDKIRSRTGGFLTAPGEFDAEFFGITPAEATAMDPQHRLVLEAAWEAVEYARIDPRTLHGSDTGVYVGAGNDQGYGSLEAQGEYGDTDSTAYLTGSVAALASGRISYLLGLRGPAISLDTACSSGLVAVHTAVRALRAGECSLALAGGGSVLATPGVFALFEGGLGLAGDGRVKSFAAGADGTTFAEGVGMLVLERLSDAQRLGHEVLAVVRGSAVNQDGASNGLMAPNGQAQQQVIRAALADAGVPAAEVDVVEGHGTGTALGDLIEAQALLATYGQGGQREQPLLLGSIKSNMGHTQLASGIAGVIKMVEAMRCATVPSTLHVDEPSPHVDWAAGGVRLVTETRSWPDNDRPRRAAVSSYGISGTNAHVILEQAPSHLPADAADPVALPVIPWVMSARSEAALVAQAAKLRAHLERHPELDPVEIGCSLATTRSAFEYRAVVLGQDRDELVAGLTASAEGATVAGLLTGRTAADATTIFRFPGRDIGAGQSLYEEFPVFAAAFDAVAAEFGAEPVTPFAVEVALVRLLESWGVRPDCVVGSARGEITAAHVAGVLSLTDACALVAAGESPTPPTDLTLAEPSVPFLAASGEAVGRFGSRYTPDPAREVLERPGTIIVDIGFDTPRALLEVVADGWTRGLRVDWGTVFGRRGTVALPTYAFQRQRYWRGIALGEKESQ
ncbi:type I polyketide synthase [Nocardia sp. NBC_00508]|uniref:type I polyketide synthase n=1 Tax=Nocardia sp. NBC_00508 TaxID=2975992 RepID=UPI002E811E29|nr:type I polyketide synthase [Nocardia sp. NBC_00508]WUD66569.1 type I polyketide synthase [Nocardia sp. NBC_00508]